MLQTQASGRKIFEYGGRIMNCRTCEGTMEEHVTDLSFKLGESSIVILKGLPVFQCPHCNEYVVSDTVMARVQKILTCVDRTAEFEIIRYAA